MNDFDYDVMQKAKIARSARNKTASVRGSKKCTLPSDYLTAAEKKKLNSVPVVSRLDKPMGWTDFKAMSEDLRRQYIRDLQLKYGANSKMLGAMFGVSNQTVLNVQKALGIVSISRGTRVTERQEAAWQAFLEGGAEAEEVSSCEEQKPTEVIEEPAMKNEEAKEKMCLDCFTACITGQYSPEAMMAILGTIPIPEGKCTIRIEVTKV